MMKIVLIRKVETGSTLKKVRGSTSREETAVQGLGPKILS